MGSHFVPSVVHIVKNKQKTKEMMSRKLKKICMNRGERWDVRYVAMKNELTLPWLVSLEARALL